jgi:protocatechuate 3,4-dioxygenase beta subunit
MTTPTAGTDDDVQIGYLLSRRDVLSIAGGAAAAAFLAACIVRPALTEGPYFVEELLNRSDIRTDPSTGTPSDGVKLRIRFLVSQLRGSNCSAYQGAVIDVWHCDAMGIYSDVSDSSFSTKGRKFLRGYQRTDASGIADFTTIYPGWYSGRAVHIHFKIRTEPGATSGLEFTSQLFFDVSDTVFGAQPYSAKGQRDRLNAQDGIYTQSQGQTLLPLTSTSDGYGGTFALGLQVS